LTENVEGLHLEVVSGVVGTRSFGAAVDAALPTAKLAALAKLAEKL
jgi:hypothetical protein